jgi:hypothetical protein
MGEADFNARELGADSQNFFLQHLFAQQEQQDSSQGKLHDSTDI